MRHRRSRASARSSADESDGDPIRVSLSFSQDPVPDVEQSESAREGSGSGSERISQQIENIPSPAPTPLSGPQEVEENAVPVDVISTEDKQIERSPPNEKVGTSTCITY